MGTRVFEKHNVLSVGEVSVSSTQELQDYVLTERGEFDMAIPFVPPGGGDPHLVPQKAEGGTPWRATSCSGRRAGGPRFFSNHDKPRQVSLYGDDKDHWEVSAKMLGMLLHSLPGTPFVYRGRSWA